MMNKSKAHLLSKAISLAADVHKNQLYGKGPYILHPLRVMNKLTHTGDYELMTTAVLHDVVEDSDMTIEQLRAWGFSERVLAALKVLTHDPKIDYDAYIGILSTNKDAVVVKMADLEDNSDITHLRNDSERSLKRVEKYCKAYVYLKKTLVPVELLKD